MISASWTGHTTNISIFPTGLTVKQENRASIIMPVHAAGDFPERELSSMVNQ
jgi:hypothetical protein